MKRYVPRQHGPGRMRVTRDRHAARGTRRTADVHGTSYNGISGASRKGYVLGVCDVAAFELIRIRKHRRGLGR